MAKLLALVTGGATDLLRIGVGLFDRVEHRLWVGRLSHGLCFLIDPVANERIIPTLPPPVDQDRAGAALAVVAAFLVPVRSR